MSIADTLVILPRHASARLAVVRQGLFGSLGNTLITIATTALLLWIVPPLFRWAILDAT